MSEVENNREPPARLFEAWRVHRKSPIMASLVDAEGRLFDVSDRWLALTGHERTDLIGQRLCELLAPECRCLIMETVLPELKRTGACYDEACQIVGKSGEIIDVLLSSSVEHGAGGEIERMHAVIVDVTQQRKAEARWHESKQQLQDFLAIATDWLWEMDADLRFTFLSGGDRSGLYDIHDVLGKTRWDLAGVAPDCNSAWRAHVADLKARRPFRDFEYDYVDPDGIVQYRVVSGKPIIDEHGVFRGYRGTGRDNAERKTAEKAARRLSIRLPGCPIASLSARRLSVPVRRPERPAKKSSSSSWIWTISRTSTTRLAMLSATSFSRRWPSA